MPLACDSGLDHCSTVKENPATPNVCARTYILSRSRKRFFLSFSLEDGKLLYKLLLPGENVISASVGVASWPDDGVNGEELLAEADRRMYADKNSRKQKRSIPPATEQQSVLVL